MFRYLFLIACAVNIVIQLKAQQVRINEVMTSNASAVLDHVFYNYTEWVELYNPGSQPANIGELYLSDDLNYLDKYRIPLGFSIPANGYKVFWMDRYNYGLHTNFRLRSNHEIVILSDNGGTIIDSVRINHLVRNHSLGRYPDGAKDWHIIPLPSPGSGNTSPVVSPEPLPEPIFDLTSGRYESGILLSISNPGSSGAVYYTTDGSEPSGGSPLYTAPIPVNETRTIKARILQEGRIAGPTVTNTYFIKEHFFSLPVVAVSTDPKNLSDPLLGIYVEGTNGKEGFCYGKANWNQDWERAGHFEFFTPEGVKKINTGAGITIMGGCSRTFPQKSLGIYFRDKYGTDEIRYPLFESKAVDRFKSINLRNSGNDFNRTHFQDAMMQTLLMGQMDIDYQGYTPAIFYLNGDYWGIQNIREKTTEDYLYTNYNLHEDSVDMLEWINSVIAGDNSDYNALLDFLNSNSLSVEENYRYVYDRIDMESFIDYQIAQIYFANTDWPGNNVKFWKAKKPGSRWRWILYDTDFGFGLAASPDHNTLAFASESNGPDWPNPPWSTLLFRKLLENESFRKRFVEKFTVYIHSTFQPARVTGIIDSLREILVAEMPYHFGRWGSSMGDWDWNIGVSRDFANRRPAYMMQYLQEFFDLENPLEFDVSSNTGSPDRFSVNGIIIRQPVYKGQCFSGQAVHLKAMPGSSFRFDHWEIQNYLTLSEDFIPLGSEWKYLDAGIVAPVSWKNKDFNDSSWKSGKGQLGYGDGDETTLLDYGSSPENKYISYYFRKSFDVADTSEVDSLCMMLLVDDGAVVYLNGMELKRINMPEGIITAETTASTSQVNENIPFLFNLNRESLLPGRNTLAVEVHQVGPGSSDVSFDLRLFWLGYSATRQMTDYDPELDLVLSSNTSCIAVFDTLPVVRDLVINEFCARNMTFPDEFGEYNDWIELYNAGHDTVMIGGLFMTNSLSDPLRSMIPDRISGQTMVPPGEFRLLWADRQLHQGLLHLDFTLEKSGGELAIVQPYRGELIIIDSVKYTPQISNYSFGRYGDGSHRWFALSSMTPGSSNLYTGLPEEAGDEFLLSPNPVTDLLKVHLPELMAGAARITFYDALGRISYSGVLDLSSDGYINLSGMPSGIYYIHLITSKGVFSGKIIKQ